MTTRTATRLDPRYWQVLALSCLVLYSLFWFHFSTSLIQVALTLGTALATQYACTRIWRLPAFDPKSALISGLGLCFLLRTNLPLLAAATAVIAIASKFLLRWKGKHVWNPTNFALVAMLALSDRVWVSPGQWGSVAFFCFLVALLGGLVVNRSARSDVTYAFLASWAAVLLGRALWLGQPMAIPLHQLQNGTLLIFAFHMISDPKTTPDTRAGRILFAALVALGAGFVQFVLYRTNGLLWSYAVLSVTVPLIDRILPGVRFAWSRPVTGSPSQGVAHEPSRVALPAPPPAAAGRLGAAGR
ncbi:MAG TPA: RnfABCDGE type electron transport complex subunit D [Candidatus Eisenbacteria bacterium]|nr:RnfABCDGE type electron transport complex subunit D [Candidatus Eisenbacteria bacterium]